MNSLTLIWKNLFRRKLRTGLLLVSIMVAFVIFGVLGSFKQAFDASEDFAAADRLVVSNKVNFTQPLPIAYAEQIRRVEGVQKATHANWFGGYFRDKKNATVVLAVDPETYLDIYAEEFAFDEAMRRAFATDRTGALVGEALARKWGWKVGDRIPISSSIFTQRGGGQTWDVTIRGVFAGQKPHVSTDLMLIQYDYFDKTRAFTKDLIGWVVLRTATPAQNEAIARKIDLMFANSAFETSTETSRAFNKAFASQLGNIAFLIELVVGASFATILLIVGNTMAMAIRERAVEIAVLKTLGFSSGRVLGFVVAESVLLALAGGLPGLAIAYVLTRGLRERISGLVPGLEFSLAVAAAAIGLMIAFGIVTGLAPALRAFRLKIATVFERG